MVQIESWHYFFYASLYITSSSTLFLYAYWDQCITYTTCWKVILFFFIRVEEMKSTIRTCGARVECNNSLGSFQVEWKNSKWICHSPTLELQQYCNEKLEAIKILYLLMLHHKTEALSNEHENLHLIIESLNAESRHSRQTFPF